MTGVNKEIPNMDAEGIERHVNPEILKKLEEFVRIVKKKNPKI